MLLGCNTIWTGMQWLCVVPALYATMFGAASPGAKIDAACAGLHSAIGIVIATPDMAAGAPSPLPDNCHFIDLRTAGGRKMTVTQSGLITPNHAAMWAASGVIADGGPMPTGRVAEHRVRRLRVLECL